MSALSESSINVNSKSGNSNTNSANNPFYFTIPALIHPNIADIKMKDLVHYFRAEMLVFDLVKRSGVLFNLPDILQCGMMGISGVANEYRDLWKLLDNSMSLLKAQIFPKVYSNLITEDFRSDIIDINEIFGRIKLMAKNILKDK